MRAAGQGITLTAIGFVRGDFDRKFGTPRQPGLAPASRAAVLLHPPFDRPEALRGLEGFSHVWVVFGFHLAVSSGWAATVRPPRLGGNRRVGVFASRSPFRPNFLGLSVVAVESLLSEGGHCGLRVSGHDFVDGTPVYDIKPYLPYADVVPRARTPAAFDAAPQRLAVRWSPQAEAEAAWLDARRRALIEQMLALDPRPAYRHGSGARHHGMRVAGVEVRWRVVEEGVVVDAVIAV